MGFICSYSNCKESVYDMPTLYCKKHYEEYLQNVTEDILNKSNHKEIIKPNHYHEGVNVDPIWYGKEHFTHEEMKGFYKMNVIKYVTRADKKNGLEDLIKAKNYLEMLIENVENNDE
ncbi:hypothetical protein [Bacillus phage KonjoTrouble]|uniref:Nucleotide kinase n=4 Tax=Claudivirus TaxID=2842609 RepID=A0A514AAN5_9CAUD|nr:nucleotide kinase [Bacillus phage Claudi]YP_009910289.1 nucleotide kinase [Bacillus phage KonjoTrouble]YP_010114371.1 nucleotide kinase [Bacillus phage Thornton]QDH50284.1 hypothetical protein VIOLETTEMAD_3 [Bacillus phage VioletteMad]ANT41156.1 hypothetical protein CLAUDI_2 [Bacillus phage Claudi]ASU04125.1 hypothetical protein [Bacillus phage KonjoTrouble]QQM14993.1 hypothetical protein THORNTON_2 [Bacillus phage Thornton]